MAKKLFGTIAISSMIAMSAVAAISASVAWFQRNASLDERTKIQGWSQGAYFAGGHGVDGDPYIINKPVHLYNLAWLQYIGYFNDGQNADGTGAIAANKQTYFKLEADIDMSSFGSALPPIGTSKYPFVGNFDGNGKTISNCVTTNDFSETTKHPSIVKSITDANCVGLFGVVGKQSGQSFTYTSSINEIKNLGILGATVKSSTSTTLAGIAAGYVNGTLDNVAVNQSNLYTLQSASPITSITNNVSDYSLVGYTTNEYKRKIRLRSDDANIPTVENPNTAQGGDKWGGSINMLDMFNYLRAQSNSLPAYEFPTEENVYIDVDGTETRQVLDTDVAYDYNTSFGEYIRYEGGKVIEDGKEYASFSFARSSGNSSFSSYNNSDNQFICLYGGSTKRATKASYGYWDGYSANYQTKSVTTYTDTTIDNYVITDGLANYLRINGGTISNSTTLQTGCYFTLDNNGYLYTSTGTTYYLYKNGENLAAATTRQNNDDYKWVYDEDNSYLKVSGGNYYLRYTGTRWEIVSKTQTQNVDHFSLKTGNYYLNANGTNLELSSGDNTNWYVLDNNVYTIIGGTRYYICYSGDNILLSNNGSKFTFSSGKFYYTYWSYYNRYYRSIVVNNATLTLAAQNSSTNNATVFTQTYHTEPLYLTAEAYYTNKSTSVSGPTNENSYYNTLPTYFPLTREKNEKGEFTGSSKPDIKNTGYVVSGSYLTHESQGPYGDIRVSRFAMSDISVALSGSSSYSSSKLEVVTRTCVPNDSGQYSDSGWTRISDEDNKNNTASSSLSKAYPNKLNYKTGLRLGKYKNSRTQLGNTLSNGGGNIYGLHFMDASISTSKVIEAKNVTVLDGKTFDGDDPIGTYYPTYELPEDSIDFNLKNQGFINFFAGTYFSNGSGSNRIVNDTFFSLHTITRNQDNTIADIQEIKKIYAPASGEPSDENPYIYSFDGNKPTGSGDLVFDTEWITNPNKDIKIVEDAVYYFEVPVNAGEFALGSVSTRNGAYLMYLDIGAGIDNYKDIVTTESISTAVNYTDYPLGIDFLSFTAGTARSAIIKGGDSACIKVGTNSVAGQTIAFIYSDSTLTVSTASDTLPAAVQYESLSTSVKKKIGEAGATDLTFSPPSLFTSVEEKVTLESFNVFTSQVTRSVTQTITYSGGATGEIVKLPTPVTTTGFTITEAATYSVEQGNPATIDNTKKELTWTGSGTVKLTMTYAETMNNVEEWATATTASSDNTEGTIFEYHLRDYDDPNLTVYYYYDVASKTYTLYINAANDTELYIDSLPPAPRAETQQLPAIPLYTVEIVVNGDTAHKTVLTSASTSITSIPITGTGA
ncbi:MAG: hypothetical protein E7178_03190 [Erysipelotrichaceae bacterium]|jgi:hypothetical protein|nr:hypothetical protein [Erysipelotrichaceae bacterium]